MNETEELVLFHQISVDDEFYVIFRSYRARFRKTDYMKGLCLDDDCHPVYCRLDTYKFFPMVKVHKLINK